MKKTEFKSVYYLSVMSVLLSVCSVTYIFFQNRGAYEHEICGYVVWTLLVPWIEPGRVSNGLSFDIGCKARENQGVGAD